VQSKAANLVRTAGGQGPLWLLSFGLLMGCVPPIQSVEASPTHRTPRSEVQPQPRVPTRATAGAPAAAPRVPAAVASARATLDARLKSLGRSFNGKAGIAVRDLQTGWSSAYNGDEYFPQQSVSKFWVALTALDKVDRGRLDLTKPVVVRREDLTLFHQPIAGLVRGNGYATTLRDLMTRALTQSDNTANDVILRRAGGPEAVRAFLKRHDIDGVRFGPGERLLQSQTAGLTWRPEYSVANGFERARANLPAAVRRAAFERYLANPIDGATPAGLVDGLSKLHRGELLSPASTQQLLSTMSNTKTGAQRLKGGLRPGWKLAHKTGTGQNLDSMVAGYNDVGILTAPDGRAYAIAVMIGRTEVGIPTRQKLMNDAVRAVIDYQENMGGD